MTRRLTWFLSFLGFAAFLALNFSPAAQQTPPAPETDSGEIVMGRARSQPSPVVKGIPYSADETIESTHTQKDGVKHVRVGHAKIYRDSEGRLRHELSGFLRGAEGETNEGIVKVIIIDPVARDMYILLPGRHTAEKTVFLSSWAASYVAPPNEPANRRPRGTDFRVTTREDLGMRVIDGVASMGTRISRTLPAGIRGNDEPEVTYFEIWRSPEMHTTVMFVNDDPRNGRKEIHYHPSLQDLGTQMMEGFQAHGTRVTATQPADPERDRPAIDMITEVWRSSELHTFLLRSFTDARIGVRVTRRTHIVREEPALTLFQPPSDYTVEEVRPRPEEAPPWEELDDI